MKEVTAPASDVEGELAATIQLMPTLPPPFTRQRFTEEVMTKRTAEAEKSVRGRWEQLRKGGEDDRPSVQGTVLFRGWTVVPSGAGLRSIRNPACSM